jgi:hypothetical protein
VTRDDLLAMAFGDLHARAADLELLEALVTLGAVARELSYGAHARRAALAVGLVQTARSVVAAAPDPAQALAATRRKLEAFGPARGVGVPAVLRLLGSTQYDGARQSEYVDCAHALLSLALADDAPAAQASAPPEGCGTVVVESGAAPAAPARPRRAPRP